MGAVLLTGATGFVGREILDRLLDRRQVFALVRAENDDAAAARLPRHARLTALAGDIERPGLGLSPHAAQVVAEQVTTVIHCAASVSFDLSLVESRRINVDGTRHVAEVAERCAHLERLTYISTAYVVESAVRPATDLGHEVVVAAAACVTGSRDLHDAALRAMALLAEITTVDRLLAAA